MVAGRLWHRRHISFKKNGRRTSEKRMRQMAEIMREGGNEMKNNKKMIVGFLAPAVIIFLIVFYTRSSGRL